MLTVSSAVDCCVLIECALQTKSNNEHISEKQARILLQKRKDEDSLAATCLLLGFLQISLRYLLLETR